MVAPAPPLITPNPRVAMTNKDGTMTGPTLQLLQRTNALVNGSVPAVPSTATHASNIYTLTPYNVSPQFGDYYDGQIFPFMAPATSTGLVTATVTPPTGVLDTLPVYKNNGGTQAGSGDIVAGRLYNLQYHSGLGASGGFSIY